MVLIQFLKEAVNGTASAKPASQAGRSPPAQPRDEDAREEEASKRALQARGHGLHGGGGRGRRYRAASGTQGPPGQPNLGQHPSYQRA